MDESHINKKHYNVQEKRQMLSILRLDDSGTMAVILDSLSFKRLAEMANTIKAMAAGKNK